MTGFGVAGAAAALPFAAFPAGTLAVFSVVVAFSATIVFSVEGAGLAVVAGNDSTGEGAAVVVGAVVAFAAVVPEDGDTLDATAGSTLSQAELDSGTREINTTGGELAEGEEEMKGLGIEGLILR